MKYSDGGEKRFKEQREINSDFYGSGIFRYAERWANLMESRIEAGENLEDCAKRTSHEADTEGITGAMYGFAVQILARDWFQGERLRKWHNLDVQIGTEGEAANKKETAVLNPAMLTIRKKL